MNKKTYSRTIFRLFLLNAIFLTWAVLWKCAVPYLGDGSGRMINWIPFYANMRWEMQLNVLLFIPFGFFLSALEKKSALWRFWIVVLASALLETAQFVLSIGISDVTDILLNTLGGVFGLVAYAMCAKLFGRYAPTAVTVACVCLIAFEVYFSVCFLLFGSVRLGGLILRI